MRMISYQSFFYFYHEVIVPEFLIKNIKIKRPCKELLEDTVTLLEQSEITEKL